MNIRLTVQSLNDQILRFHFSAGPIKDTLTAAMNLASSELRAVALAGSNAHA